MLQIILAERTSPTIQRNLLPSTPPEQSELDPWWVKEPDDGVADVYFNDAFVVLRRKCQ